MENVPNYGPWTMGKDATPEELKKMYPDPPEKSDLAILYYSPPFMPMDSELRQIWDALLSVGIVEIQIGIKDGKLGIMPYRNQTLTLESGKFYPIEKCGGEEQQKAIDPYLKKV